jgi:hypothetical protein
MNNLFLMIMIICLSVFWYGFQSKRINATTGSETGSNLSGVSLDGVILCNTNMPDGTINNSGCKN